MRAACQYSCFRQLPIRNCERSYWLATLPSLLQVWCAEPRVCHACRAVHNDDNKIIMQQRQHGTSISKLPCWQYPSQTAVPETMNPIASHVSAAWMNYWGPMPSWPLALSCSWCYHAGPTIPASSAYFRCWPSTATVSMYCCTAGNSRCLSVIRLVPVKHGTKPRALRIIVRCGWLLCS